MKADLCYQVLLFFSISFCGWLMEVILKYMEFHRFINRGFLIGPYCPIYGFGSVLILNLLSRYADEPVTLFVLGMVVCGTLEYLTSYIMEKLFHARWWDYSQRRFNLNGRICANTLIPFGLLGMTLVYIIKPALFALFQRLPERWLYGLSLGLCAVMLADIIISANVLGHIRHTTTLSGADDTETLNRQIRLALSEHGVLLRRTLRAFPYARHYNARLRQQWEERRIQVKTEAQARRRKMREEIERYEQKLKADRQSRKHQK